MDIVGEAPNPSADLDRCLAQAGEAACLLPGLCPRCGAVTAGPNPAICPVCNTAWE